MCRGLIGKSVRTCVDLLDVGQTDVDRSIDSQSEEVPTNFAWVRFSKRVCWGRMWLDSLARWERKVKPWEVGRTDCKLEHDIDRHPFLFDCS
jgi:hypothetical protein